MILPFYRVSINDYIKHYHLVYISPDVLGRFLWQIRKTSALAIIGSFEFALENENLRADIRRLSEVSRVFSNDNHWETPYSLGLAAFLNGDYEEAQGYLNTAITIIDKDPNIAGIESWERIKEHLRERIALCNENLASLAPPAFSCGHRELRRERSP
jgi:tetratricopeptide (TPR) repeat protein